MRGNKAGGVVDISGRFPTKRDTTTYKKPTTPLKAKKRPAVKRKFDMVVSRLVIAYGLKEIAKDILWKVLNTTDPTKKADPESKDQETYYHSKGEV